MSDRAVLHQLPLHGVPTMPVRARSRRRFFFYAAAFLLILVIIGFTRTFFLRPWFPSGRPIPNYLYAHGTILTAWFAALVGQTWLVATGRVRVHRTLGSLATGLAALVVVTSAAAVAAFPGRQLALGVNLDQEMGRIARIVWVDVAALLAFVVLVGIGVAFRRRPDVHKRAMLLASVSIIQPALGRMFRLPLFAGMDDRWLSWIGLVALVLALSAHDAVALKRLHRVTVIGGGLFLFVWTAFGTVVAQGDGAKGLVRWLVGN